jgi:hypothetical protein
MWQRSADFDLDQTTSALAKPGEQENVLMATYVSVCGETLAKMPAIDPADLPGLLQMLVSTVCGPELRGMVRVTHAPVGLEML